MPSVAPGARGANLSLIGLGNIGRPLASYLARLESVRRLNLVDFDSYVRSNLPGQAIRPEDVGRPKVTATAAELRRIRSDLQVIPLASRVENAPLGLLRADVLLAALDSRRARMWVSELATRLGLPVIDAGVEPEHGLLRLTVYRPGPADPCYECMQDADNADIEQVLPCHGQKGTSGSQARPTRAPAYLGGLAASLAAAECDKLITGSVDNSLLGHELIVSVSDHTRLISTLHRKPDCRFDHRGWPGIRKLVAGPDQLSLGQLLGLDLAPARRSPVQLRVALQRFVTRVRCAECGNVQSLLYLSGRLTEPECSSCRGRLVAPGFSTFDFLALDKLPDRTLRRPLRSIGFLPGDVFTLSRGDEERHYEIGGAYDG